MLDTDFDHSIEWSSRELRTSVFYVGLAGMGASCGSETGASLVSSLVFSSHGDVFPSTWINFCVQVCVCVGVCTYTNTHTCTC
jgi:hypothetical protein